MHRRIKEGILELSQPEVQKNPLSNHKGKGVVAVIICADPGEDEEERPILLAVAITTMQKSSRFKNLFGQLELTVNEQRIATEALVSIASRAGVECLSAETRVFYKTPTRSLLVMKTWKWDIQIIGGHSTWWLP